MTYKQVKIILEGLLEDHAQIKAVKFCTASEWIKRNETPELPCALFTMTTGQFESGQKNFDVRFLFLDKTGKDGEFEIDVVSDQTEIANDMVALINQTWIHQWTTDGTASFDVILGEFEDNLSGVEVSLTIKTPNAVDTCAIPTI
jgi:hypothetical protein